MNIFPRDCRDWYSSMELSPSWFVKTNVRDLGRVSKLPRGPEPEWEGGEKNRETVTA